MQPCWEKFPGEEERLPWEEEAGRGGGESCLRLGGELLSQSITDRFAPLSLSLSLSCFNSSDHASEENKQLSLNAHFISANMYAY